ncbi:bifunctional phosphoglucose/phosphomannose isomerase [Bernardetia sp. OM2101]|uniref:bifunctional phosphoglucose/phosphomannose isomerase n=1 Tax=Bernardetia sp. OM2101 TaxID=3344876 RepID=UPI0035CE94DC
MMNELISSFSQQLEGAYSNFQKLSLASFLGTDRKISNIVVVGLGGSGIGGNLVQTITRSLLKVPYQVCKTYNLPSYINENTLLIASSFSGNTEETLVSLEEAQRKGAYIACLTSGGKIQEIAMQKGFDLVPLKSLAACPRAHLPYSAISLLLLLNHYELIDIDFEKEIKETVASLNTNNEIIKKEAKQLAISLKNKFPILYADAILEPMLIRFQQQINENAKQLCHVAVFPEMNHNELVGWHLPKEILSKTHILLFHSDYDHERVSRRMEICEDIFNKHTNSITHISAKGNSFLEQVFYLIYLTDWVSYYLAEENSVDPFPVEVINYLKSSLQEL